MNSQNAAINKTLKSQIRSEPAYGHTAGLTVYILENGREKVMFWGDVVTIAPQVDNPDISLRFDSDATAAAATRRKLLEDTATKGYIVAPDHLPFPGFGHISIPRSP